MRCTCGHFKTDKISVSGGTVWVDSASGLLVKESGKFGGLTGLTGVSVELQNTNIASGSLSFPWLIIVIVIVIIAVVAVVLVLVLRRRKHRKSTVPQGTMATTYPAQSPPMAPSSSPQALSIETMQKLQQLKTMLDKGLITQEDYDAQRKRLLAF
jgi:hypothetical protein